MDKDNNCLSCGEHIPIVGTLNQAANDNRFFSVALND
jgi:hypothetical protein